MKSFRGFLILLLGISFFNSACSEVRESDHASKYQPSSELIRKELSSSGSWQFSWSGGGAQGDGIHVGFMSSINNSTNQAYTSMGFNFTDTANASERGRFSATPLIMPTSSNSTPTGTSDIESFYFSDGSYTYTSSSPSTVTMTWINDTEFTAKVLGTGLTVTFPGGGVESVGDFSMDIDAKLPSDKIEQFDLPGSSDCPEWTFSDSYGQVVTPPQRSSTYSSSGHIVHSGPDPGRSGGWLLKMQKDGFPERNVTVFVDKYPSEGFIGILPEEIKVMTAHYDGDVTWFNDGPGARVNITDWYNGVMTGRIVYEDNTFTDLSNQSSPYVENGVSVEIDFKAAHPKYELAVYAQCLDRDKICKPAFDACNSKCTRDHNPGTPAMARCRTVCQKDYSDCLADR